MTTEYFQWGTELETGIKVMDEQHAGLIETINELVQMSFRNEPIESNTITEIYASLTQYVANHFSAEETLMEQYKIDPRHRAAHDTAHKDFNQEVASYFSDLSSLASLHKLGDVAHFLIRWLAHHILSMDRSLARQIEDVSKNSLSPRAAYERDQNVYEYSAEPLLKALKAMFYVVSEKNKELKKLNDELEAKVKTRTRDLEQANDRLEYIAMRDELTGLFNRRYAISQIETSISEWRRYKTVFSLLFIDAVNFKAVNDNFGHECGDNVLKWIATFLRANTRLSDIVCRLGGDEFVVICNHCDGQTATQLAKKLNSGVSIEIPSELKSCWNAALSIGAVEVGESCQSASEMIKRADNAMYLAKKSGRESAKS